MGRLMRGARRGKVWLELDVRFPPRVVILEAPRSLGQGDDAGLYAPVYPAQDAIHILLSHGGGPPGPLVARRVRGPDGALSDGESTQDAFLDSSDLRNVAPPDPNPDASRSPGQSRELIHTSCRTYIARLRARIDAIGHAERALTLER